MKEDPTLGIKVAVLILMVTFLYIFMVVFWPMTKDGAEQAKTITPFLLGTIVGTIMGFYYGNSHKKEKPDPPKVTADLKDAKVEAETKMIP